MPSSRRQISSFNLSFLDIMFCGFGAVVLLVLIINSNTVTEREEKFEDLQAEVERLQLELAANEMNRERLLAGRESVERRRAEVVALQKTAVEAIEAEKAVQSASVTARKKVQKDSDELKQELLILAQQNEKIKDKVQHRQQEGRKVREFEGDGHRQYLTGLKLGGKRVLILLDSSASMLDRKVVDIIRRKVMDDSTKRYAPKWRRAVRAVEWIVANLPADSTVQVLSFNVKVEQLGRQEDGIWLSVTDVDSINSMLARLTEIIPTGGTSLEKVFSRAKSLTPRPDNIILLTDGLPTQGSQPATQRTVTGAERVTFFEEAVKKLPAKTPVNTVLFPMEGDPMAAVLFWKLAVESSGAFFTPTQDWP